MLSIVKFCMVAQYYIDPKILFGLVCFLVLFVVSLFRFLSENFVQYIAL